MTALTQDRNTVRRDGQVFVLPVAGSKKIYAGSIVAINSTGYVEPASDAAGLRVVGRAEEQVDNSAGSDGDKTIKVQEGVYQFAGAGFGADDVGKPAFVADDQTVNLTGGTNKVCAGIIEQVDSATEIWIRMGLSERAGAAQADEATADAATQTGAYVQADVQSIATLANALKTAHNALLAKLRAGRIIAS